MSEPVEVRVREGDCPCPDTPHEVEVIELEPEITLPMGSAAVFAIRLATEESPGDTAAMMAAIAQVYLPLGIRSWTFTEEDGSPVKRTRENLERLIPWDKGGMEVTERADSLYAEKLMTPLVRRFSPSVRVGRTGKRTSPIPLRGPRPPKSSTPSSLDGSDGRRSAAAGR